MKSVNLSPPVHMGLAILSGFSYPFCSLLPPTRKEPAMSTLHLFARQSPEGLTYLAVPPGQEPPRALPGPLWSRELSLPDSSLSCRACLLPQAGTDSPQEPPFVPFRDILGSFPLWRDLLTHARHRFLCVLGEWQRFSLDKEKDLIVSLFRDGEDLLYTLSTPNHHSGNLIRNLAALCRLPLAQGEAGLLVIEGEIPCYINAYNEPVYIFRLGGTKVANITPGGDIEMKASVPSISKTLMSQTKDYRIPLERTLLKTYIPSSCKFHTDLHTHMNANLSADLLIALGIFHQVRYPLYYIRKLKLVLTPDQEALLSRRREQTAAAFEDSTLTGKYLSRRIDDHTYLNFASLILDSPENARINIPRIRASLAVLKDGQAVFSNVEKVYLYRYVFTRGVPAEDPVSLHGIGAIPDPDIRHALLCMLQDRENPAYSSNTLFQNKLLWIARSFASRGVNYAEISDTSLVKPQTAASLLAQIHAVMPAISEETGVMLRFLAAIRRVPLTILKDSIPSTSETEQSLQVLSAVAMDPYVAGSDILGEEINDIRDISEVVREIVAIAAREPTFVVRIHAGENDSLRDNVANSLQCVVHALAPGQPMPSLRIGHGLYTTNLRSSSGLALLSSLRQHGAVLEFQITSNVRLNNLSLVEKHPLREYLGAGVQCVQGTDGGALYGTDSIDEQLALQKLLSLTEEEMRTMRAAEDAVCTAGRAAFSRKLTQLNDAREGLSVQDFYTWRIRSALSVPIPLLTARQQEDSALCLQDQIAELPGDRIPVILAGGSFNNDRHRTSIHPEGRTLIRMLLDHGHPEEMFFVVGHELSGYERLLVEENKGRFDIYAFVPSRISAAQCQRLRESQLKIRIAIEPFSGGTYKSISYEIFKRRFAVLVALDGNSAAVNLIQEARNARIRSGIFINPRSRMLMVKARSLQGYTTLITDPALSCTDILRLVRQGRPSAPIQDQ